ncbi:MAG: hypothetical protein Q9181_007790 [Wetmoreana brouardii]
MKDIKLYWHTLGERLSSELQSFTASVLGSLLASSDTTQCSCHHPGHCRIVLVTVTADDGSTRLEPTFQGCSCLPIWYDHHQRQLDFVGADLKDKKDRIEQLVRLQEGLKQLLIRNREIFKAELNGEVYWLRQEYARSDTLKKLKNRDLYLTFKRRGGIAGRGKNTMSNDPGFFQVDKEDLWVDPEFYEYQACCYRDAASGEKSDPRFTGSSSDGLAPAGLTFATSELLTERAALDGELKEEEEGSVDSESTLEDSQPSQFIGLNEVANRFNGMLMRAKTLMLQWQREDVIRMAKFTALYSQPRTAGCCCPPEHRLYHAYLGLETNPTWGYLNLSAEKLRSGIRLEQQRAVTADRKSEIEGVLHEIREHIAAQLSDLKIVQGSEGRRQALFAYLKRYEQRDDLRLASEDNHVSAGLTSNLLAKTDSMLRRWAMEDATRRKHFDNMLRKR